jgi:hypothetical protein
MSVDDHRLIGSLWGVSLVVDNAMQTIIQDMVLPDHEPDLPLGLLGEVGHHLLRVGDAMVRRANSPAWPA